MSNTQEIQAAQSSSIIRHLWNGDAGLDKTYWLWGVVGGFVLTLLARLLAVLADAEDAGLAVALVVILLMYGIFMCHSIWMAAKKYQGWWVWRQLARLSVFVGAFALFASLRALGAALSLMGFESANAIVGAVLVVLVLFWGALQSTATYSTAPKAAGAKPGLPPHRAKNPSPIESHQSSKEPVSISDSSTPPDQFWAEALGELDGPGRKAGLWARSFSEADGDEAKAKAKYLACRSVELECEHQESEKRRIAEEKMDALLRELEAMPEEERAYAMLPKGSCPNCKAIILLKSSECPKCRAVFGPGSSWSITPLAS